MLGAIRTWDVLSHPIVTIRSFGWGVFFRALFAGHGQTFLSLLGEASFFQTPKSSDAELIGRCIQLELQAAAAYALLAEKFPVREPVHGFLIELARQEQDHADLLGICRREAARGRWDSNRFHPWHDYVPLLEEQMQAVAASLHMVPRPEDALRVVFQIESSEINNVFLNVIDATDSAFVRKLRPFREAVREHIGWLCQGATDFARDLVPACQELYAKFL